MAVWDEQIRKHDSFARQQGDGLRGPAPRSRQLASLEPWPGASQQLHLLHNLVPGLQSTYTSVLEALDTTGCLPHMDRHDSSLFYPSGLKMVDGLKDEWKFSCPFREHLQVRSAVG